MNKVKWFGRSYTSGLFRYIDRRMKKSAEKTKKKIQSMCPVDTGRLRESIHVSKVQPMYYEIGSDLEYAKYVEFGTSRTAAHPFFRPGLKSSRGI